MTRLADQWEAYRKEAMPEDATSNVEKTRDGFYVGVATVLAILHRIGEDDVDEELAVDVIEGLAQEAGAYIRKHKVKWGDD